MYFIWIAVCNSFFGWMFRKNFIWENKPNEIGMKRNFKIKIQVPLIIVHIFYHDYNFRMRGLQT